MSQLVGSLDRGLLFVLSAPAGTGKTTLVDMLTKEFPSVVRSISYTTRPPRHGEIPGLHYHFLSEEEFKQKIEFHEFLEYVELYGYYYGTSKQWIEDQLSQRRHVILVIDTQGGLQIKPKVPATFIFIRPPSMEELRQRLVLRKTELPAVIEQRLAWAEKEIQDAQQYDYMIVNDNLAVAYQILKSVIIAEEHRIKKEERRWTH